MEELDACRKTDGERVASAAWTGIARAFASEGREAPSIESVSGCRMQITGACYCLLSFREVHDLAGDSGR
jgi:hypothetical protein